MVVGRRISSANIKEKYGFFSPKKSAATTGTESRVSPSDIDEIKALSVGLCQNLSKSSTGRGFKKASTIVTVKYLIS